MWYIFYEENRIYAHSIYRINMFSKELFARDKRSNLILRLIEDVPLREVSNLHVARPDKCPALVCRFKVDFALEFTI